MPGKETLPLPDESMSVQEAGRRGGKKVNELYGSEFYSKIGRKADRQ